MAVSVVMPALELAQETGKLLSWRKREGERVSKGEPLLEIETDKAVVEVEAPGDGILAAVTAREGAVIPVGQTIAWLVQPGEMLPPGATAGAGIGGVAPGAAAAAGAAPAVAPAGMAPGDAPPRERLSADSTPKDSIPGRAGSGAGARISPKARRLAHDHGVDISHLKGSGSGGEIVAADILAATESSQSSFGRLMAERTTESWTRVPHFFLSRDVEAAALNAARERLAVRVEPDQTSGGVRLTYTDLFVALVARTLKKHPRLNASWSGDGVRLNADVNVAIAIAVTDAVVTGVIPRADTAALRDIALRRDALSARARAGRLQPADIMGATFTISNLGMYRVDAFTAIIVPPQAGILAVGAISDRVVAIEGRPAVRPMLTLTLSCDHRVVDGARAAAFLDDLAAVIRSPETHLQ